MNLPRWLHEMLSKKFSEKEMLVIDKHWFTYNEMSLGNSTQGQLVAGARNILKIVGLCHGHSLL